MKILEYPWHQAHLYRMATALNDIEFTVAAIRLPVWNQAQRPVPINVSFIEEPEIVPYDYDLAVLHLDQWCDRLNLRALPYRLMKQTTKNIRQVVIMHGTPDSKKNRQAILRLIDGLPVVCNSKQAAREWDGGEGLLDAWGEPQFTPIIHGYHDEFYNYPSEKRSEAVTICSGGELSYEYHGLPLVERLKRDVPLVWYGPRGDRQWKTNYDDYRDMLSSALIYFSPTRRAPMPGSRTEAMLSGACIVSVPGNDFENIIVEHGMDAFIVNTYEEARDTLNYLLNNPGIAYGVGQAGRKTALREFGAARYADDWRAMLRRLL